MHRYYLAVDIGASSGRHILGHLENGKMVLEEIYRFPNGNRRKDGELVWDIEELFSELKAGMKKCRELGKIPVSIGVDTWAVDFVLLDEKDRRIGNAVAYRDSGTNGMDGRVYDIIPEEKLYERTGIQKQIFNTIYQLMAWKTKKPEQFEKAKTMLLIPDYLHFLLSGVKATEYTNATTTQLVSPITKDWDYDLIHALGYSPALFQKLVLPGTCLGFLTEELQREVGFNCKVVVPATHDTASAVMAVPAKSDGVTEEDILYISSGTWSLMGTELCRANCSLESKACNFTNEGGYDYRFRYLKNIMGLWMIQSVKKEIGQGYSFGEICEMAAKEKIASIVDVNDPRFLAPADMTEEVRKACEETAQQIPQTLAETAAVIYNSLAKCYGQTAAEIEKLTGKQFDSIHVVGGGANAAYLNELTAKVTGKAVFAGPTEATAIGNLSAQMIAAGELKDLAEVRNCIYESFEIIGTACRECENVSIGMVPNSYIMRKGGNSVTRYESAKAQYAKYGVDTDAAIAKLRNIPVSLHCWQGDDVTGFDHEGPLTGGIQTTGNYPGKAATPEQLMADIDKAISLMPGKKKLNLHACYAIFEDGEFADRDALEPKHFSRWVEFAKERNLGIDFNPTFFSHERVKDGLTLSSPDKETRDFWIRHGQACIRISEYFANETGIPCVMNIWTGDGFKDIPADRMGPRMRYKESIEEILSVPYDREKVKPCIESKVFGIGVEAYTAGSAEFALTFAATHEGCLPLMDNGHYHPTEVVSDKIPALLCFFPEIALHITRPIRWDSDHVVLFDDETKEMAKEIVRCDGLERTYMALDYFDASINRISAWVVGFRSWQKALLSALVTPNEMLKKLQDEGNQKRLMVMQEELKTMPFGDIWAKYCEECGVAADESWFEDVMEYEKEILADRGGRAV